MTNVAQQLRAMIEAAKPRLLSIPESLASEKPYPDKWSRKEILGHLIDSAANNHQRIVRMQEAKDIGAFTYSQQHWVQAQSYQAERWQDLVEFWCRYNTHLAHILGHVDPGSLSHVCDMGYSKPASLEFVITDYLSHLEHHLEQMFGEADPRERDKWIARDPS